VIRNVKVEDAQAICKIYNYYIENTTISFEEVPVSLQEMERRINSITTTLPWIVYEIEHQVVGYAYAGRFRSRSADRFSVEASVYIDVHYKGKGIGLKLYSQLLDYLKEKELHCVMGVVAVPNEASAALHKKLGFEKVGTIKEVGYKFNQWVDVMYWQYLFDR
jgi:phosphinothricin acetyltransferase